MKPMAGLVIGLSLLLPVAVTAQTAGGAAEITGTVRDTSGAVLPGVTVEASSPALIEKVRVAATDGQGIYRITGLRPGTYTVTFTLPGFRTLRREGVELSANFTATVHGELTLGALEETITVTGAALLVDTQSTRQQRVLERETLDALPTARMAAAYTALLPGAGGGLQDITGADGNRGSTFSIHGNKDRDVTVNEDGLNLNLFLGAGNGLYTANHAATQEVVVETAGMSAESAYGGVVINVIPREGGNSFSGYFSADGANGDLQGNNLSDELRGFGVTQTPKLRKVYDVGFSVGGPIKRDRLWFYTAHRWWGGSKFKPAGFHNLTPADWTFTPDFSRIGHTDLFYRSNQLRLTWQAAERHKFNIAFDAQRNCDCAFQLLVQNRSPEATAQHWYDPVNRPSLTWTSPVSSRLLLEAGVTSSYNGMFNRPSPLVADPNAIAVTEVTTGLQYRNRAANLGPTGSFGDRPATNTLGRFTVSYVTGSHSVKTGVFVQRVKNDFTNVVIPGGMDFRFRNGAPISVRLWAQPYEIHARHRTVSFYAQDQWTLRRLTVNGGVRFESLRGSVPAFELPAGPVTPARSLEAVSGVPNWKDLLPRVGGSYDLFGDGRTAIKAFVGKYVAIESLNGYTTLAAPINLLSTNATRTWNDRNRNFAPDCDLRLPQANGECGPMSETAFGRLARVTEYAGDVLSGYGARPASWQVSAAFVRELWQGTSVEIGYFRTSHTNFPVTQNRAVAPADFDEFCVTAPADPRLPGDINGSRICGLYDIRPARFGQVDNFVTQATNFGKQTEVYNGIDLTFESRFGQGGMVRGGMSTGRTVTDRCFVVNSPGELRHCHVQPPWSASTQVKFSAIYPLPWWGIQASAVFQNVPGIPITATYVASNAEIAPSLGRNLAQGAGGTVNVELIPPNTVFRDRGTQVDFRLSKSVRLQGIRLQAGIDVFNLFNSNAVVNQTVQFGPVWLRPQEILPARMMKLGVKLDF